MFRREEGLRELLLLLLMQQSGHLHRGGMECVPAQGVTVESVWGLRQRSMTGCRLLAYTARPRMLCQETYSCNQNTQTHT